MARYSEVLTGLEKPTKDQINHKLKQEKVIVNGIKHTYILEQYLGGGSYGDVFKVRINDPSSTYLAMKISPLTNDTRIEAEAYNRLKDCGSNVVCIFDVFKSNSYNKDWIVLVQELLESDLIQYNPKESEVSDVILDLLFGLACIHAHELAHMDIKANNLFVSKKERNVFKIGDLGLVCDKTLKKGKLINISTCTITGTLIPPDLSDKLYRVTDFPTARSIDIWTLGVYFYKMLAMLNYLPKSELYYMYSSNAEAIVKGKYHDPIPATFTPTVKLPPNANFGKISPRVISQVLLSMLQYDSAKRPRASEIIKYIIREMGWASPGQEIEYSHKIQRLLPCSVEFSKRV